MRFRFATLFLILFLTNCRKDSSQKDPSPQYFMSATIDGQNWNVAGSNANFGPHYDHNKNRFTISIGGDDQTPNTICNYLAIEFDFVPKIGRYYFNNNGSVQSDSGIIALYSKQIVTKWSTGGYVDIEHFTIDSIKGKFNFTAKGDANNPTTSTITNGSFCAVNVGGNDVPWNGP